jgi:hypothetical protein
MKQAIGGAIMTAVVIVAAIAYHAYFFNGCKQVGHSTMYCILDAIDRSN